MQADTLIVIPTYNEKENIARMIDVVFSITDSMHILVVDDGSPDGTAAIVKSLQFTYPERLFINERAGKLGLGTAYIHGFRWGLARHYEYIIEMDADFSHPPEVLPKLRAACASPKYDVAIGSRYVTGGNVENWGLKRVLLSKYASLYVRMVTWMPVKDTTAGFVCWSRKVLEHIDLDKIGFVGYAFQIEMKFAAWSLGFKLTEIPITFKDRELGQSKMSMDIFNEAVMGVLKMKFKSFTSSYGMLSKK